MKLKANYFSGSAYVNDFGNETLKELQMLAEKSTAKSCPFCGGEAVLFLAHIPFLGCGIECSNCHCKTLIYYEGTLVFPGQRELKTVHDCMNESLRVWNSRV